MPSCGSTHLHYEVSAELFVAARVNLKDVAEHFANAEPNRRDARSLEKQEARHLNTLSATSSVYLAGSSQGSRHPFASLIRSIRNDLAKPN